MKYLILPLALLSATAYADYPTFNSKGIAMSRDKSRENALIAAHFECGRKGLWADLTTAVYTGTDQYREAISGSNKRITKYATTVKGICGPDYLKDIPVEVVE
jgi:hypothetical protein